MSVYQVDESKNITLEYSCTGVCQYVISWVDCRNPEFALVSITNVLNIHSKQLCAAHNV